ncbi:MAG: hypothetical protein N2594_06125, partial [Clostridiales bacterium]|nr:hypothetical protein [Clostridiales bacterium]
MEVVRGKRIEKVYIGVACLLVIIFILTFFWPNIITYYKNLQINAATNQIQLATKVGDDIYFYSGYFTDSISLYKYNIKSKKLDRINDIGVSDLKYYDGYVYYVDYENFLYRYDIKKGKSELILSNC